MLHRADPLPLLLLLGVGGQQAHGTGAKEPAGAGGPRQAVSAYAPQHVHQAAAGVPEEDPAPVLRPKQHDHQLAALTERNEQLHRHHPSTAPAAGAQKRRWRDRQQRAIFDGSKTAREPPSCE